MNKFRTLLTTAAMVLTVSITLTAVAATNLTQQCQQLITMSDSNFKAIAAAEYSILNQCQRNNICATINSATNDNCAAHLANRTFLANFYYNEAALNTANTANAINNNNYSYSVSQPKLKPQPQFKQQQYQQAKPVVKRNNSKLSPDIHWF